LQLGIQSRVPSYQALGSWGHLEGHSVFTVLCPLTPKWGFRKVEGQEFNVCSFLLAAPTAPPPFILKETLFGAPVSPSSVPWPPGRPGQPFVSGEKCLHPPCQGGQKKPNNSVFILRQPEPKERPTSICKTTSPLAETARPSAGGLCSCPRLAGCPWASVLPSLGVGQGRVRTT
jgi:hypothetical protein